MSTARDRILQRVRSASAGLLERATAPAVEVDIALARQVQAAPPPALLEHARLRIEELGDTLASCPGVAEARIWLEQDIRAAGLTRGAADPEALDLLGLAPGATLGGGELHDASSREVVMAAHFGISLVDRMAAETGTLAFVAGPGRTRLASLAPDVHYALVPHANLVPDLVDVLAWQGSLDGRTVTWITGSSRTGDIDGELIHGAHGPARLVVIVFGVD